MLIRAAALSDPAMRGGWQHYSPDLPVSGRWRKQDPNDVDMTGGRYGRVVVVGICTESDAIKGGRRWWCRCACGAYQSLRKASLVSGADLMCARCAHQDQIRRGKEGVTPLSETAQKHNAIESRRRRVDLLEAEATRLRQEIKQLES